MSDLSVSLSQMAKIFTAFHFCSTCAVLCVVCVVLCCLGSSRYYDLADFRLAVADTWLRRRDGRWELKTASQRRHAEAREEGHSPMQHRQELSDQDEILSHVCALGVPRDVPLDKLADDGTLLVLAALESVRDTYT